MTALGKALLQLDRPRDIQRPPGEVAFPLEDSTNVEPEVRALILHPASQIKGMCHGARACHKLTEVRDQAGRAETTSDVIGGQLTRSSSRQGQAEIWDCAQGRCTRTRIEASIVRARLPA